MGGTKDKDDILFLKNNFEGNSTYIKEGTPSKLLASEIDYFCKIERVLKQYNMLD